MIQRVQTLWLLLAFAACIACLCLPVGQFINTASLGSEKVGLMFNLWVFLPATQEHLFAPWALFALLILVATGLFVDIFLFKHRLLQSRLAMLCAILLVCWYLVYAAFIWMLKERLSADFMPTPWAAFPAIGAIASYMAFRGILKDEMLVRSLNRIR